MFTVLGLLLAGCEQIEYGELGDPFTKTDGIKGTWLVSRVVQVDEVALAQGGAQTEMDLTDFFSFSTYHITFNVDAQGNPTTFEVGGDAPNFVDSTGIWTFDEIEFPTYVELTHPDSSSVTSMFTLIAPPRTKTPLRMKFQRFCKGKIIISYKYEFEIQQ